MTRYFSYGILGLVFYFNFLTCTCYAQDQEFIVRKGNDTTFCSIVRVTSNKIYFIDTDKNKFFNKLCYVYGFKQKNKDFVLVNHTSLRVERQKSDTLKAYTFRPNSKINILTTDNHHYKTKDYQFSSDTAITTLSDTISLKDIKKLQGKTYMKNGRFILGISILATSVVLSSSLTVMGLLVMGFSGSEMPIFLIGAIPALVFFKTGALVLGKRNFNISDKWKLKIVIN